MKISSKFQIWLAAGLFISMSSLSAFAGPGASGGGNTVKGHPIEDYLVDPYADLPDFKNTIDSFLRQLGAALPQLATEIEQTIDNRDWYLIPAKLDALPSSITGLNFESDQPFYQTKTEIFVDRNQLTSMDPAPRQTLYKHEVLMANFQATSEQTREIMAYLKKHPKIDAVSFRSMLYYLFQDRGPMSQPFYWTKTELDVASSVVPLIQARLIAICKSNMSDKDKTTHLWNILADDNFQAEVPNAAAQILAALAAEGGSPSLVSSVSGIAVSSPEIRNEWTGQHPEDLLAHCRTIQ
jgi:hypothetical protein